MPTTTKKHATADTTPTTDVAKTMRLRRLIDAGQTGHESPATVLPLVDARENNSR
jgi:hypothetical protein